MNTREKFILHIDMDCFYAAVETRDNPKLKGKPVIVGAKPGSRGVISACNYEARKFGLHSAMPISEAFKRCPQGVFLDVDMDKYEAESEKIMSILRHFTDQIEPVSVDEAYMDISDLKSLFGTPDKIGYCIKTSIKSKILLTASIGIGPNKFISKIASDLNKPDGFLMVSRENVRSFLDPLPVSRLPGVGEKTNKILKKNRINTIADLYCSPIKRLTDLFGIKTAEYLFDLASGNGESEITIQRESKSISREHTFQHDTCDHDLLRKTLLSCSDDVARRLRQQGLKGRTIALNFRTDKFTRNTRQETLMEATDDSNLIFSVAEKLFNREISSEMMIRLIGMGVSNFNNEEANAQMDLFRPEEKKESLQGKMDIVKDRIQDKFGDESIKRASLLK